MELVRPGSNCLVPLRDSIFETPAEKMARQKPKPVRVALEPEKKLKVSTAHSRNILPPRPQEHLFPGGRVRTTRKQFRRRKTEARLEQIKFLVLCFLFAALILFVWKNLP